MKRILIVDDAIFMRASIRRVLERNGYQVVGEAGTGLGGFEKYKQLKPDLVTMDLTMPDVTGTEALKMIMDYDKQAKIIVISATGQEQMVKEAVLEGAKSFVVKPINEGHLIETIKKII